MGGSQISRYWPIRFILFPSITMLITDRLSKTGFYRFSFDISVKFIGPYKNDWLKHNIHNPFAKEVTIQLAIRVGARWAITQSFVIGLTASKQLI
jgi:hypothetical protein